jgi:hypothetical protein
MIRPTILPALLAGHVLSSSSSPSYWAAMAPPEDAISSYYNDGDAAVPAPTTSPRLRGAAAADAPAAAPEEDFRSLLSTPMPTNMPMCAFTDGGSVPCNECHCGPLTCCSDSGACFADTDDFCQNQGAFMITNPNLPNCTWQYACCS